MKLSKHVVQYSGKSRQSDETPETKNQNDNHILCQKRILERCGNEFILS